MAINIDPRDPGLEEALQRASKFTGTDPLTQALGLVGSIPLGLAQVADIKSRQPEIQALLEGQPGFRPRNLEEASRAADITSKVKGQRLEVERMREERERRRVEEKRENELLNEAEQRILELQTNRPKGTFSGIRRAAVASLGLTPKPLSGEVAKLLGNIESGQQAISEVREILSSPTGFQSKLKAGSLAPRLASLGDPQAQRLIKAAGELADIITRARTGAALNEQEEKFYGTLILSAIDTPEATERVLKRYEDLFNTTRDNLLIGRIAHKTTEEGKQQDKRQFLSELEAQIKAGSIPTPRKSVEDIVREGRAAGLSREKIKEKLKAAGY